MTIVPYEEAWEFFLSQFKARWDSAITSGSLTPVPDIVWPNTVADGEKPYIEIAPTDITDTADTLKGGEFRRLEALVLFRIVASLDEGGLYTLEVADVIGSIFPSGLLVSGSSFSYAFDLRFLDPVSVRGGFRDGTDWIQPVTTRFVAA